MNYRYYFKVLKKVTQSVFIRPKLQIMDEAITLNLDIVKLFSDKELKDDNHYNTLKKRQIYYLQMGINKKRLIF